MKSSPLTLISHHDILNKEQDLQSAGKLLSGRQLLWLLYDFMAMDSQKAHLMEISDLMNFRYDGHNMQGFINDWRRLVRTLNFVPGEGFLEQRLKEELERVKSTTFHSLISRYDQDIVLGIEKPSYAKLLKFVDTEVAKRQREYVRKAHEKQPTRLAYVASANVASANVSFNGTCRTMASKGKCPRPDCPYMASHEQAFNAFQLERHERRKKRQYEKKKGQEGSVQNPKPRSPSPSGGRGTSVRPQSPDHGTPSPLNRDSGGKGAGKRGGKRGKRTFKGSEKGGSFIFEFQPTQITKESKGTAPSGTS
jgi:hypothetical protein